ncbi:rhodanese family protein [Cronobacter dublinensis]
MPSVFITPAEAKALVERGAILMDIRGHDEWRREHISGARVVSPENSYPGGFNDAPLRETDTVIFHCQSGMRTEKAKDPLIAAVRPANALIMQGGINAWKAAGYPVITDRRQPLPLMRQVHIVAGTLALSGTLAGATLATGFYIIPGVIGAGLLVAGVTGWCGMAKLLAAMPWNKRAA